ncbi:MAG: FtsX-like permease family protein, partial [Ignavibacteria bacterium]|nr:FtsX-like permease family protein [Ignavibacteria bacterium]
DNVRAFADYIYKTFNEANESDRNTIEADTSKIKEKENFYFLSKITYIIAYLVILFGTITVSLFLFNLLKLHLNKVKMNIGTFKAIGLSNKESLSIYFNIIIRFIFTGIIFSLIISFALGTAIDIILQSTQHLEKEDAYFKLMDINTLVAISIVLVFAIVISWRTISSILSKSPGDLIYNR